MNAPGLPVRQIAYFVADVRAAAKAHHARFGSGPFFLAEHIPLRRCVHRGVERPLDHSSAYGQWGPGMVEFVQQNNPGPSPFHDVFPEGSGRGGLHHIALFVEDVDAAIAAHTAAGQPLAARAEMHDGFVFAFIDACAELGHMIELYSPTPQLTGFYGFVARAAGDFRGGEIVRTITLG